MAEPGKFQNDDHRLYLEDLEVGRRFTSATHAIDEAQIRAFATQFDPQPFHLDDAAAKATVALLGQSMGLRILDVGPLTNAGPIEGITALLATLNRRYKIKNSGIKITGL